jgi:hypothetical protein
VTGGVFAIWYVFHGEELVDQKKSISMEFQNFPQDKYLFIGIGSYWYWPPSTHSIAIFSSAAGITDQPLDFRGDYLCGQGRECSACIYFNQSIVFLSRGRVAQFQNNKQ